MVGATVLKIWCLRYLQCYDLRAEFHDNLPVGLIIISGDRQTDIQDSMAIS